MTDKLLNILLITNFNDADLFFLLDNQISYSNLEFKNSCVFCESFFIKFMKLFNQSNYYIYVNLNCVCTYDNIIIFNISYFYAI